MRLLLLKDVKNLGRAGDIKEVNEGYALNFLIPKKLAEPVTRHTASVLTAQKMKKERLKKEAEKNKRKLARKINGQSYSIKQKSDDKGTLYAGLDTAAIAKELAGFNIDIAPEEIEISQPIKKIGQYEITIKLAGETAIIKFEIKSS